MEIQTSEINPEYKPPKTYKKIFLVFLLVIVFFLGVQFGQVQNPVTESLPKIFTESGREAAPVGVNWQLLWDAIDQINQKYVNRPADLQKILYGAVSGAVSSLDDPYSVFLPPKEAEDFKKELKGSFEGIGAEIAIKNQQLVVVSPLEGSPAIRAGIRAGDFIYEIDGEESRGLSLEEAVSKIRGPAGTQVTLTIFHKGETKPAELKITRAKIEVKSASSEIREVNGKKIGILKLRRFGEETQDELLPIINQFLTQNVAGIVLDVRNNPGGFLETAVDVASNWVAQEQVVVIQQFGDGTKDEFKAKGQAKLKNIPTVVLINGGSASASEIVAGALKDHGIAKLVGEKTFGKGSVQELIRLRDEAEIKITIAKWLTPQGHDLNKEGIEPDEKVELTDEDFQNDRDPQLDRALEILAP
ncbi:MAG: S41 family peptidase [Candidatus Doudnabacteria bacterium]|nr:S41 family peptidase [Candidatus Doudnabacteria bacterium]